MFYQAIERLLYYCVTVILVNEAVCTLVIIFYILSYNLVKY
jgi:hypothetical protein